MHLKDIQEDKLVDRIGQVVEVVLEVEDTMEQKLIRVVELQETDQVLKVVPMEVLV